MRSKNILENGSGNAFVTGLMLACLLTGLDSGCPVLYTFLFCINLFAWLLLNNEN